MNGNNRNQEILALKRKNKEVKECTFQPDTSLTRKRTDKLYSKMTSRSRSRERTTQTKASPNQINLMDQNKLMLQGYEISKNFNSIISENDKQISRNNSNKSIENPKMFGSLQTSTSQGMLMNYKQLNRSPNNQRTFKEFYNQQMAHVKKTTDRIQNTIYKRDRIFEEMERQRNRIKHLSEESRRILSNSRERKSSRKTKCSNKFSRNHTGGFNKNPGGQNLSLKPVHERLYNYSRLMRSDKSDLSINKTADLRKFIRSGSRSTSKKRQRMFANKKKL